MNSNNAILFGGAKGYSSDYEIKNDVYIFKIQENTWVKLNPIGDIPPARAAHSACALKDNHLAIFGGTCLAGELAPDDLYVLEVSSEKIVQYGIKFLIMVQVLVKDTVML